MKNSIVKVLLSSLLVGCTCSTVKVDLNDSSLKDAELQLDSGVDASLLDSSEFEAGVTEKYPVVTKSDGKVVYVFDDFSFTLSDGFEVYSEVKVDGSNFDLIAVNDKLKFGLMYSPLESSLSVSDFNAQVLSHLNEKESSGVLSVVGEYNEVVNGKELLIVHTEAENSTYVFAHALHNDGVYIFSCGGEDFTLQNVDECNVLLNSVVFE